MESSRSVRSGLPPVEWLREHFVYETDAHGAFLVRKRATRYDNSKGQKVTPTDHRDGYTLRVKSKQVRLARVIFALHHGYWPRQVRHRDKDTTNVRIENLYDIDRGNI
jgi:hypothetical protein